MSIVTGSNDDNNSSDGNSKGISAFLRQPPSVSRAGTRCEGGNRGNKGKGERRFSRRLQPAHYHGEPGVREVKGERREKAKEKKREVGWAPPTDKARLLPAEHANSGAANVARTAARPASSPTASTRAERGAQRCPGDRGPAEIRCGSTATRAASDADAQPGQQQHGVFQQNQPAELPAAKSDRAEQRQFAAALQHVSQLHGRQPERAQQQPQAAEALERREIRVLHGEEAASRRPVVSAGQSVIAQGSRSSVRCTAGGLLAAGFRRGRTGIRSPRESAAAMPIRRSADRPGRCCRPAGRRLQPDRCRRGVGDLERLAQPAPELQRVVGRVLLQDDRHARNRRRRPGPSSWREFQGLAVIARTCRPRRNRRGR